MSNVAPAVTVVGLNFPPEPTGISPYTGAMARGLAERGVRVRAITAHPHYPEWQVSAGYGQWSRKELLAGVHVHRLLHYVPKPPTGIRRLGSEITFGLRASAARWGSPDAVVFVSPALFSSCIAMLKARSFHRRRPTIVWVQDLYSLGLSETGQGSGFVGKIMQRAEGWLLRRADRVVVIHDRFARRVAEDFAVRPERIEVVRNWTHLPPTPVVDRTEARRARGWGDETVVLHAGNMGVKQGLDNVVAAARLADERGEDVRFVLLGNGGERDRLRASADGIRRIEFIDPLPDAEFTQALAAADVLLVNELPGVAEMAVPSKLTSYFSTGRPVLAATDESGITAEEVRTAGAGVVVAAGSPDALLDGAVQLGSDPTASADLGANGKRYRETVLDETFAIDRFANLLTLLTNGGREQPEAHRTSL
ncbi:glycosyltransferase family 4 protein [Microbacterium binotii]|uniref:glycosyltransferase family 4 protein n=1 Tax=Microbacterium binotii TaxID=462710 RepID=UPI001F3F6B63|nr:glycosyltransferase family 4 protein [Microbacterium binotii]UIN30075.1 glycosyltransferase family 4 protein [Microbacterium binotii]